MNAFGITDKGKVRSANQDAYRLSLSPDGEYVLAALCDGMGGVHGGEIASAVAADSFMQYAEDMLRREPKSDAAQVLREAAAYANLKVYDRAFRDESCRGMGTTAKERDHAGCRIGTNHSQRYFPAGHPSRRRAAALLRRTQQSC